MSKSKRIIISIISVIAIVSLAITIILVSRPKAFDVIMLGAGNMPDQANLNSMGYIILTQNDKIIMVDGGREEDKDYVVERIFKHGNVVDYWLITHPHDDHIGVLAQILEDNSLDITINNLCYSFNSIEWYVTNESDRADNIVRYFNDLNSTKIKNKIECNKGDIIEIDNLTCKILRVPSPNITVDKNIVNDSSMVFRFSEEQYNRSILFLGDAYLGTSQELLDTVKDELPSYAVQMAHHGQDGVTQEVYQAINPKICFFNSPDWLWDNDNGGGYNSGTWKTLETRSWIDSLGAKSYVAYTGDIHLRFSFKVFEL